MFVKSAKPTLTAAELNHGEILDFRLVNGEVVRCELISTGASIIETNLTELKKEVSWGRTTYRFHAVFKINDQEVRFDREVGTQHSFHEPRICSGVRIWLDAVSDIFDFLIETHGECRPRKNARIALQDATLRICPEPLHPWCPLPSEGLRMEDCYSGEDCWMGAYFGASAHGGLDINHPRGTPLWAPLDIDDHFYFNSLEKGDNNNRWRGIHRWPDGSEWILQAHHMTQLTIPEHQPIKKGEKFAAGAGVLSGRVDHSHFVFKVSDEGETILLDPWILFHQMYLDREQYPKAFGVKRLSIFSFWWG